MFETSKDILYIVLSFCIIWVTVFLCWMFYYAARILRNTNRVVEEFRMRIQLLTDAINYVRAKVENISNLLTLATNGVGGFVKKVVSQKAEEWVEHGAQRAAETSEKFDAEAKAAVDRAVAATAKKMKRVAREIRG